MYIFYQETVNINGRIESLFEEDKNIKERFILILYWEKRLETEHIPKDSKKDKILIFASLSQRESNSKEVQEWTKRAIQHCDSV